ncbi:MAG: acyl-ACP--UDP-N-acetylglucosamine O-acyltransferase [Nitrospina sp.]|nr:acyl-ACP--UDP-N-acetylglucosamine O-acyltransferase [Nitrospina sp.]MBT3508494.1 acyl-ACP--UDP-N-acetylglucosamine O-acyltransferase [Nitrospina sp.]MBT3875270.1 acyl-ACP--UDP-N-acetylglucosamine O-acyltransferase [Nitrospina sp.]MBT4048645.1 acyl-ACP--UDP-N-acetylglucosamine O-acyltransferase [Nitrospina sp.]MBT4559073.1 acyl-ACP--UDP-N-acetylglucosamine O-acyltransferase [Nitrospina sp.]
MTIHTSSVIHPDADLAQGVKVGPFTTIGPNVRIGEGTIIGPNVLIEAGTVIGKDCEIFHGASLGGEPQIFNFKNVPATVEIGDGTVIREYVTIHRSGNENGVTRVGKDCLLMAYSHLGHDCEIGDQVVIVNSTSLAGHVIVEDKVFISALVGVHQFVRIGKYAMIAGLAGVNQDVLPFSTVEGNRARLLSANAVGLKRANFKPDVRAAIKKALKFLAQPEQNTKQAIEKIETEIEIFDEIQYLINFVKNSSRGVTK